MTLVEKLLAFLPPEIRVANCCCCGSLCTKNVSSARAFEKYGLKLWVAMQWDLHIGNMRPVCHRCHNYSPHLGGPPADHHATGQRVKALSDEENWDLQMKRFYR